jgi:hypothetical protein
MDAYDDFGAHMGSKIEGVYTTVELAQKKIDKLKSFDDEQIELFISYQYTIEEHTLKGE